MKDPAHAGLHPDRFCDRGSEADRPRPRGDEWNEKAGWGFGIDPGAEARMEAEFKRLGVSDLLH